MPSPSPLGTQDPTSQSFAHTQPLHPRTLASRPPAPSSLRSRDLGPGSSLPAPPSLLLPPSPCPGPRPGHHLTHLRRRVGKTEGKKTEKKGGLSQRGEPPGCTPPGPQLPRPGADTHPLTAIWGALCCGETRRQVRGRAGGDGGGGRCHLGQPAVPPKPEPNLPACAAARAAAVFPPGPPRGGPAGRRRGAPSRCRTRGHTGVPPPGATPACSQRGLGDPVTSPRPPPPSLTLTQLFAPRFLAQLRSASKPAP